MFHCLDSTHRDGESASLQANIILHFADRDEWPLGELASCTGLRDDILKQKLGFWVQNGIILKQVRPVDGQETTVYVGAKTFAERATNVRWM